MKQICERLKFTGAGGQMPFPSPPRCQPLPQLPMNGTLGHAVTFIYDFLTHKT